MILIHSFSRRDALYVFDHSCTRVDNHCGATCAASRVSDTIHPQDGKIATVGYRFSVEAIKLEGRQAGGRLRSQPRRMKLGLPSSSVVNS